MTPSFILLPLILSTLSIPQSVREDNPPVLLEITSPAKGGIFEPGQRLTVIVNSATIRDAEWAVVSTLGSQCSGHFGDQTGERRRIARWKDSSA